ncbi:DNA polymerase beta superfamily protein [Olsenella kribbiana]|uniref:DNA polymerase beta superfamily protein n=1 Tax=Olsenella kribbiana TaxID=3115221 RepID=UPI003D2FFD2F
MEVGETLDVSGWEMARSLRPVRVLNASVLVWLASPIVCRKPPVFAGMKELAAGDHHPRVGICHCLDMRYGTSAQGSCTRRGTSLLHTRYWQHAGFWNRARFIRALRRPFCSRA